MEDKRDAFICSSLHGEDFHHPDFKSLVTDSSKLWVNHRFGCLQSWVLSVKDYFSKIDPSSHWICLVALSACPLLVRTPTQVRIILSLPQGCHLLPSHPIACVEQASSHCGYDEEKVLCTFLQEVYTNNWSLMLEDVDKAYRSLVAFSRLSHGIRYIHNRICKSARLPTFIEMVTRLHYNSDLMRLVRDMVKFILDCSHLRKGNLISYVLTKPLIVTSATEWDLIEECRKICGLKWHGRYRKDVYIKFGGTKWRKQWNSTFVESHHHRCHFEMWEERLIWVSVWLARLRSKIITVKDSPKLLVLRFALLLT